MGAHPVYLNTSGDGELTSSKTRHHSSRVKTCFLHTSTLILFLPWGAAQNPLLLPSLFSEVAGVVEASVSSSPKERPPHTPQIV